MIFASEFVYAVRISFAKFPDLARRAIWGLEVAVER